MNLNDLAKTAMGFSIIAALNAASVFSAHGEEKPATSYVQFTCEPNANFFSINSLDYRAGDKPLPTSEHLFLNSTNKDKPEKVITVTQCNIAQQQLTLSRAFLNIPDDSGSLCATLDWGVFQIKANDQLLSEFISGCSFDIHVFTNEFNLHVCKSDFNETTCKTLPWQDVKKGEFAPIRIGLLGDWL